MKSSRLKYRDDEVAADIELSALKREQLVQAAMRLEQNERYLRLQEEKTRLLEEKRRAEEIERRKEKLRRIFSLYYLKKGAITAAKVAGAITALLMLLREASLSSPVAARAYRSIIRVLEQMLIAVQHGAPIAKDAFVRVFGKISGAVKSVYKFMAQKVAERMAKAKHDSAIVRKCIRKDAFYKLGGRNFRMDASYAYTSNRYADTASNYVNRAIRVYDKRYGDIFPLAIPAGIAISKATIVPLLLTILKAGAIAGVAGAIKEPLKENITKPICDRIINNIKQAAANKNADQTYLQAIGEKISSDMNTLLNILKREKSFIASKLEAAWNKVKGLFKKK